MRTIVLFVAVIIVKPLLISAGDTNFVAMFDSQWRSQNASNILSYVEANVITNRSVEVLFARGLVAAYLQKWGRGATNYFGQAITAAQSNSFYSASGRSNVVATITRVSGHFEALADDTGEPTDSTPNWDTNVHSVIFGELGDQALFLPTLNDLTLIQ